MDNVRNIASVVREDYPERVAAGLERVAAQIRNGEMPYMTMRAIVVLAGRGHGPGITDVVDPHFIGPETSVYEVLGILELAKLQEAQPDGWGTS